MNYSKPSRHSATNNFFYILIALALAIVASVIFLSSKSYALDTPNNVNLYLFWGEGCPHCISAKKVLEPYTEQRQNIDFHKFEVYYNADNQAKIQVVSKKLGFEVSGVPLIIVGDKPFVGFSNSISNDIKNRLEFCSTNSCPDSVADIVGVTHKENERKTNNTPQEKPTEQNKDSKLIDLPLIGTVNVANMSLPILTIVFGLLDGFNPCAMWALLFIITLLVGMKDRRKMWLYGVTFIGVSAIVYFIFMAAWLNLFLFIGHVTALRIIIGLLALGAGGYYLYDWYRNRTGCAVTDNEKRKATFVKLRNLVKENNLWVGLGGIALLAMAVNAVELACSTGLPVIYTGILSAAGLATWQYYAYMLLYILFFMLDDLIVFTIAMVTLKAIGIESKYMRATRFIGGIVMLIIGLLLIFAPHVLMFG